MNSGRLIGVLLALRRLSLGRGLMEPEEAERAERVLATARVLFAVAAFVAISIDPTEPTRYYFLAYTLLLTYILYSFGVLIVLTLRKERLPGIGLCAVDLIWVSILTVLTQGPNSPFFLFLIFVVVASAHRWGFWETIATGVIVDLLFVVQEAIVTAGFSKGASTQNGYNLNVFVIRSVYVLIISVLLGYLAQANKRQKAETWLIAKAIGKAQAELALSRTLEGVLGYLRSFYDAEAVLVAVADKLSGRAYLTECNRAAEDPHDNFQKIRIVEIEPEERSAYLFATDAHAWHLSRSRDGRFKIIVAVNERGQRVREFQITAGGFFWKRPLLESVLAVGVFFGEELSGCLYVLNPRVQESRQTELAFMQRFSVEVTPAIYNVYLWRRLKSKIGAMERARIARELHDGVIQSLIGLEMHMDAAKLQESGHAEGELLSGIQSSVRKEIQSLRELINQLRSVEVGPGELVPFLVGLTDRFSRDMGISARVISDSEDLVLPPSVCREIAGIVREALANVRKHSGARNVLVRFNCTAGLWNLVIDDDGRGFDFSGQLTHQELDDLRKGPVIIKERVRLLKGDLTIQSRPGAGSCLSISAPVRPA